MFISQRDAARHDVRVKVASGSKVNTAEMGTYALRPFRHVGGLALAAVDEARLKDWVLRNLDVLINHWDSRIPFTEDALEALRPV